MDLKHRAAALIGCNESEINIIHENLGGGTNNTGLIEYNGMRWIVRLGTRRAKQLRINYASEKAAYEAFYGDKCKFLAFDTDTGDCVRQFLEGRMPSAEELSTPEGIELVASCMNELHKLKTDIMLEPDKDITKRFDELHRRNVPLPEIVYDVLNCYYERVLPRLNQDRDKFMGLFHGDPFAGNFLIDDSNKILLVDFEFAGYGDIFFDLGNLAWGYPLENRIRLLKLTVGYSEYLHKRLYDAVFEAALWNVGWSFIMSDAPYESNDYYNNAASVLGWLKILSDQKGLLTI